MLACSSLPAVLASRMKRWNALSSAATPTGKTFRATRRSMEPCHAS
jgi:hypothetical protein